MDYREKTTAFLTIISQFSVAMFQNLVPKHDEMPDYMHLSKTDAHTTQTKST